MKLKKKFNERKTRRNSKVKIYEVHVTEESIEKAGNKIICAAGQQAAR